MAALAWAGVPGMVHPAAAGWPPPPWMAHTSEALRVLPSVRREILHSRGLQLADGDGIVHPLQLADEGGDVLQILLGGLEVPDQVQGDVGKDQGAVLRQIHLPHQAALNLHPLEGLDPEVPLVHPLGIKAGAHQGGGDAVGGRGGVGVDKAPGVGGDGHIEEQGNLGGEIYPHSLEHPEEDLPAGGAVRVHAGGPGIALLGAVVVDGQVDPVPVGLGAVWEHPQGGHIHRHHRLGDKVRRGQHPLQIGVEEVVGILVGQEPGGLSLLPQGQAQGAGAADGVPIGPAVGEDEDVVQGQQALGGLLGGHGCPPCPSTSWRSFRMWAASQWSRRPGRPAPGCTAGRGPGPAPGEGTPRRTSSPRMTSLTSLWSRTLT